MKVGSLPWTATIHPVACHYCRVLEYVRLGFSVVLGVLSLVLVFPAAGHVVLRLRPTLWPGLRRPTWWVITGAIFTTGVLLVLLWWSQGVLRLSPSGWHGTA